MKTTNKEKKLMVSLVILENPSISLENINLEICKIWNVYLTLKEIKNILDGENFDEDFELENRKIQYYYE